MIVYDATKDIVLPPELFPLGEKMIRCVYDHNGYISSLSGNHLGDGVYLNLKTSTGYIKETASNPVHHHLGILSRNPYPYADLFGTRRFVIEHNTPKWRFLITRRMPGWEIISETANSMRAELNIE